jgi:hypothetical protein
MDRCGPFGDGTIVLWLVQLKDELETPDLWAELKREKEILAAAATEDADNAPFDDAEKQKVLLQLNEVRAYTEKTYSLDDADNRVLNAKLDDLGRKLDSMGKREWITYAAGTLALLQATVLPPETSHHLFVMLLKGIGHFVLPGLTAGS